MHSQRHGLTQVAAVCALAICTSLAAPAARGAESFPIRGTPLADYIVLLKKSGDYLTVKINGKTKTYKWKSSRTDREIKAGAGADIIKVQVNYGFLIRGEGGDDTIHAYDGQESESGRLKDYIIGGDGGDTIYGGAGNDWISGDAGKDEIHAGPGNDVVYGNTSEDTIRGGAGNDLIDGGSGDDTIWGEVGDDMLYGESGKDRLFGGPGDDLIEGGDGNDIIKGDAGSDILCGEAGSDDIQDAPRYSESQYDSIREDAMDDIENRFGVNVTDYGRHWNLTELSNLSKVLQLLPDEVTEMWHGNLGKLIFRRKEKCDLPHCDEFSTTGLKSNAVYVYDTVWARDTADVDAKMTGTMVHETGHAYRYSPRMSASEWREFRQISGWSAGKPDPGALFVSEYAETNSDEDWAESFMYYFLDPDKMTDATSSQNAPEKYAYLNAMFGIYSAPDPLYDKPTTPAPAAGPATKPSPKTPIQPGQARPVPRRPGPPPLKRN